MKKLLRIILISVILTYILFPKNKSNPANDFSNDPKYKPEYIDRYIEYKNKYQSKNISQIILDVNIGLDNPFYTNVKNARFLNTNYILVNKYAYLDKTYVPNDLVNVNSKVKLSKETADMFNSLVNKAKSESKEIVPISGYRSYKYQKNLYDYYYKIDGEKADMYSARPGYSEHQTGLAIDVSNGKSNYTEFENTDEFIWMKNNAYKYGFILRYPKNKENITGYSYESWHYRYVGIEIASYIQKTNITFDEYFHTFIE